MDRNGFLGIEHENGPGAGGSERRVPGGRSSLAELHDVARILREPLRSGPTREHDDGNQCLQRTELHASSPL